MICGLARHAFAPLNGAMPRPPRRHSHRPAERPSKPPRQGWDPVAAWYDKLVGDAGSDYHQNVIIPACLKMLDAQAGESVIDICCGQGVLAHALRDAKLKHYLGIDASPRLIDAARQRHGQNDQIRWLVADACQPGSWADGSHDAAACIMAVHDVEDLTGLFRNLAHSLRIGGRAIIIQMHPCFRIPRQSHWGWDADQKIQYRRLDAYSTAQNIEVVTHPSQSQGQHTHFFHRPLSQLLTSMGQAGLACVACEELHSHRRSQVGPFSKAEHRAAAEFPLFLAIKAVRQT